MNNDVLENIKNVILSEIPETQDYTKRKVINVINSIVKSELKFETKLIILRFAKHKKFLPVSANRLLRIFYTLKVTFADFEPNFKKITIDDVETIYSNYTKKNWQDATRETNWIIVKNFLRYVNDNDKFVKELKEYNFKLCEEVLEPSKMLKEKDIFDLIQNCNNQNEQVLIAIMWDSGARIGEILNLKYDNFDKHKKGYYFVTLDGKTGKRFIPLYWSSQLLEKFLDAEKEYVFYNYANKNMNKKNVEKLLKRLKKQVEINKHIYAHLFRHSRATFLARHLTDRQMCYFFGWSPRSKMPARYAHLCGYDLVDKMKEVNKVEKKLIL